MTKKQAADSTQQTAAARREVRNVAVAQLWPAAWNARKRIDEASLEELVASIRQHGMMVPLLARPVGGVDCEIVCGHRRFAAALRAGLSEVPCEVRELGDEAARELALVDNLQRKDLEPMDEAEAYGTLMERAGATVESVAAAVAKSASYVGRRLQLLTAIEPVREALKHGAIEVGHALELARLDEAQQRKMLSRMQCGTTLVEPDDVEDEDAEGGTCRFCGCTDDEGCPGGCSWANAEETVCTNPDCLAQFRAETGQGETEWRPTHYSVTELRREIAQNAFVDLAQAPFPLDATLAPLPCTACPKRAGNAQLLFDDCAKDTCTDRPCYQRKVNAWIEAQLKAAADEKRKLLKLSANWHAEKDVVQAGTYYGARVLAAPQECAHGEAGIWIDGKDAGRLATACRNEKCAVHFGRSGASSRSRSEAKQTEKEKAARKALLAKVKAEKAYRLALFDAIGAVNPLRLAKAGGDVHRRLTARVAKYVFSRSDSTRYGDLARATGIHGDYFGWAKADQLEKHLESRRVEQQILFAAMAIEDSELCVHEHDVSSGAAAKQRKLDLEDLAEIVGVDWKALRKQHAEPGKAAADPSAAPQDDKRKTKAPAKKGVLDAATKKRIAEAQKKRWAEQKKAAKKGGRG